MSSVVAGSFQTAPTTLKPRASKSCCIEMSSGISSRQGTHQVAQKFKTTTRPRKSFKLKVSPVTFFASISGAGVALLASTGADVKVVFGLLVFKTVPASGINFEKKELR